MRYSEEQMMEMNLPPGIMRKGLTDKEISEYKRLYYEVMELVLQRSKR